MKKTVVIIIAAIYGISIVLVTLFGLQHKSFNDIAYVDKIEIIEENASESNGEKIIMIQADESGGCQYQLVWKVTPEIATNTDVRFSFDDAKKNYVSIDKNGLVTMTRKGAVTITIIAADGDGAQDSIMIICY